MLPKSTQFEKLLEAVPDSLVGVDPKGVIRFVNRQTEVLFGYDRQQLIGEHIDLLVPEPLWQVYAEHREDYFADPANRSVGLELELVARHQEGSGFPINVTMSLIDTGDVLLAITGFGEVTPGGGRRSPRPSSWTRSSSTPTMPSSASRPRASLRAGTRPPRGCMAIRARRSSADPAAS